MKKPAPSILILHRGLSRDQVQALISAVRVTLPGIKRKVRQDCDPEKWDTIRVPVGMIGEPL